MRIILDTNVLMSGIFFGGPPAKIIDAWLAGKLTFVVSPEIIDEYQRVAKRLSKKYPRVKIESLLALALGSAEIVAAEALPIQVCTDPHDDKFLACALSAEVGVIVSGDNALKILGQFQGVKILTPAKFVRQFL